MAILKDPTQDYTTAILNDSNTEFIIPTAEQLASRSNLPTGKVIKVLGKDQRIIAFEIGDHDNAGEPGFDLQDNIFIVTSGVFEKKFKPTCFGVDGCS
ncbi:MAG: hypothetical protein HC764_14200 [Pleurocapsa sp. CRU_1_2]|nr:hypothetical protein [Pleurocapsa sp. CRU_1_2]